MTEYILTTTAGYHVQSGDASTIIKHLLDKDADMSGIGIKKKHVVYWKIGLSKKALGI